MNENRGDLDQRVTGREGQVDFFFWLIRFFICTNQASKRVGS